MIDDEYEKVKKINKRATCLQEFTLCEVFFTLVFFICLYIFQIDKLWDEKYMDSVVEDWQRSPFVEV